MIRGTIALAVVALLNGAAHAGGSTSEYVFLVKAFHCKYAPENRTQTGFRLHGVNGIVTALHGVADAGQITAMNETGRAFKALRVIWVDVVRDLALLGSTELDGAPSDGLTAATTFDWATARTFTVIGHPLGVRLMDTMLRARVPAIRKLNELVPPEVTEALRRRNSPNPSVDVVSLQGNLLPGHSGAPILDTRGRVVAVADGGLMRGTVGISWAIPIDRVIWGAKVVGALDAVAKANPSELFALELAPEVEPLERLKKECLQNNGRWLGRDGCE